ncbi:hypothetical protein I302_104375 [Kwoniella bestiolae CBS 10118]|uniref:Nucleolar protein 9 n=1 Tax=Kwoniella bestiolae CBS 10118 TaxID=1296100 RepID=A0A1B9GB33_9TREE|nr:hypothetical protein I302_03083 [Kwoniella bestiolae CBS 10118]OCF28231.1 hypothetical protein I302_03083 [Kwoniella bestiolae CBS 10118]
MPKEQIRKRGRRVRKGDVQNDPQPEPIVEPTTEIHEPVPSSSTSTGIHPSRAAFLAGRPIPPPQPQQQVEGQEGEQAYGEGEGAADWSRGSRVDSEFPFGVLDPDVKAYFRNVEEQIKDWEGVSSAGEEREDRQLFLTSVLSELRSHELPTSTDPETSIILERLLPSLNDWGRRVIGDSFGDKWEELIRHRFGSHVVQTWLTLAAGTLDRETKGIYPPQQSKQDTSNGSLPKMTELFTNIIETLSPSCPQLLSSPHSAPPLRLLLLILTPNKALPSLESGSEGNGLIRSKRSNKFRKNQDVKGKSILGDEEQKDTKRKVPKELVGYRKKIREDLMSKLGEVEWKAMGVDTVGSATIQMLLEFEVEDGDAEEEGSLFDIITEGLITQLKNSPNSKPEPQQYLSTLLQTQTGTRLFESLLSLAPEPVFKALWSAYFVGKLGKLAGHPYANFVTAKGVSRLDKEGIEGLISEVKGNSGGRGLIKAARTSVIQALVDRSVVLGECQKSVLELLYSCLELPQNKKSDLVPCLMALKTYPMYQALLTGSSAPEDDAEPTEDVDKEAEDTAAAYARRSAWENRRNVKPKAGEGEILPNMQGCLILQGMMGMAEVNGIVLESLVAQPLPTLLTYARSPISSHLFDKVFTHPAVPPKYRRKMMMLFMDSWKGLVEDRIGSRVVDTVWEKADGYMKEKIARTLIPHIVVLGQSQYAKYFMKRAELSLLSRRPDEWREKVVGVRHHFAHQKAAAPPPAQIQPEGDGENRKRKKEEKKDEIDLLFDGVEGKKKKSKKSKE